MAEKKTILDYFDVTEDYLSEVVFANPSLRGMVLGYLAESKLRDIFANDRRATATRKDDDHDRKRKGDLVVTYKGHEFKFESKALQTNHVEILDDQASQTSGHEVWVKKVVKRAGAWIENPDYRRVRPDDRLNARFRGKVQCDASDRRTILLPQGTKISTTCLQVGEFDILAAGLFAFRERWDFAFALNQDLPRSNHSAYSARVRKHLLATLVPVTWPPEPPFVSDPFVLLERLVEATRPKKS